MPAPEFLSILLAYLLLTAATAGWMAVRNRELWPAATVLVLCAAFAALTAFVAGQLDPTRNFLVAAMLELVQGSRGRLAAFLLGIVLALPWSIAWIMRRNGRRTLLAPVFLVGALCAVATLMLAVGGRDVWSPYLPHPEQSVGTRGLNAKVDERFVLELVATLGNHPIRIAADADTPGRVYISMQVGIAAQSGIVRELQLDEEGRVRLRDVAETLNRPYGLAVRDGDVYVSRSGQFSEWRDGRPVHHLTGAVTRLRDTDGDGRFDYYHDVVGGLPGARAPDYLHQNNQIAFSPGGDLYITSGISSDGQPPRHDWEGTILLAKGPDFQNVEVFARGLRNTFGLAVTSDGRVYATDNDAQTGPLGNIGDKLIRVHAGDDFGHPYAPPGAVGVAEPIALSRFALAGMTVPFDDTLPDRYRDSLYVVSYGEGRVLRYERNVGSDGMERFEAHPFAVIPGATDITVAGDGVFYVSSYENKTIHRIKFAGTSSPQLEQR